MSLFLLIVGSNWSWRLITCLKNRRHLDEAWINCSKEQWVPSHLDKLFGWEVSYDTQSPKCINKGVAAFGALLLLPLAPFLPSSASSYFPSGERVHMTSVICILNLVLSLHLLTVFSLRTLRAEQDMEIGTGTKPREWGNPLDIR